MGVNFLNMIIGASRGVTPNFSTSSACAETAPQSITIVAKTASKPIDHLAIACSFRFWKRGKPQTLVTKP